MLLWVGLKVYEPRLCFRAKLETGAEQLHNAIAMLVQKDFHCKHRYATANLKIWSFTASVLSYPDPQLTYMWNIIYSGA